jgi:hypothetical protein
LLLIYCMISCGTPSDFLLEASWRKLIYTNLQLMTSKYKITLRMHSRFTDTIQMCTLNLINWG